jgi:hypothetical protein
MFYKKKKRVQRSATLVHRKYTRERLRGAREERKKIGEGNHSRGQLSSHPSEKSIKKEM